MFGSGNFQNKLPAGFLKRLKSLPNHTPKNAITSAKFLNFFQKLRALSLGGSKKIENQRIASGNWTRLGTIKETFEELHFL